MKINPGLRVLPLGPGTVQIGLGGNGIVLENLSPAALSLLGALRSGLPEAGLAAAGAACGLSPGELSTLLAALAPVLIAQGGRGLGGLRADRLASDAAFWSASYACDGGPLLAQRGSAVVRIIGLSRTGSLIAQSLAGAGVGTVLLEDPAPVRPGDVGPGAYRILDVGLNRMEAVRRQIRQLDPTVQAYALDARLAQLGSAVDLVVYVARDAPEPGLAARLTGGTHAHLGVISRELDSLVGPLVIPGLTACLECVHRHRADHSPGWQDGVAALRAEGTPAPGPAEETSQAVAAAGLAAMQALLYLDGVHRPGCVDAVLRIRAADGSIARQEYAPHPECGCRLQRGG